MKNFDLIILGAIGNVFGHIGETLEKIKPCLSNIGYVVIDDSYLPDNSTIDYEKCIYRSDYFKQIYDSKFEVIDEIQMDRDAIKESEKKMYIDIERRANELIQKYPEKNFSRRSRD